jgi:hypothetical protein
MDMKTTSISIDNNLHHLTRTLPTVIVAAYGTLIEEYVDDLGWEGYWVTFMFRHISGLEDRKIEPMHREICRAYQKLATRAVRKPRSEKWAHLLPKGIFFTDVPGYTKSQFKVGERCQSTMEFICMGSMVVPKQTRLKERLDLHFLRKRKLYVTGKICRIHAEPITSRAAFVTDYGGKAIKRRRFSTDHVLVLPRIVAELPTKTGVKCESGEAKAIKDIQSSMNVSDIVAKSIYLTKHRPNSGKSRSGSKESR